VRRRDQKDKESNGENERERERERERGECKNSHYLYAEDEDTFIVRMGKWEISRVCACESV